MGGLGHARQPVYRLSNPRWGSEAKEEKASGDTRAPSRNHGDNIAAGMYRVTSLKVGSDALWGAGSRARDVAAD
ncbi:hypothetical protein CH63R_02476 [Colletotrichum higginsianum IMI 349063]|uniref:Uncharacterized protein n=1 Tax=Colletotrichum higginsianum (strain IMI 349063) TaxID=759273 RepID=A0A1B7YNY4_COLHI|nr:hypothetical protein CH63R_02476 [Colletotrichum higginsianum IMI 349063]OBR13750.1 hypothetical protein CH63R_02476 [Colletotrichum higginsianum IMI 349063]GJC95586.1 hypothetical protein ColKHC_04412 [Colletotrichum higginsianum]